MVEYHTFTNIDQAPIGGVLFSLEEASYFFPAKTLFRTFFCCICATLTLKALNPYGTQKVAMFEVRYLSDWEFFEMIPFIGLGVLGGACGALFIKASSFWARSFRKIRVVKQWPLLEVMSVALVTGLLSYWSPLTKSAVAKLLLGLASDCENFEQQRNDFGICPSEKGEIMDIVRSLGIAFLIKGFLTIITFGIVSLTVNIVFISLLTHVRKSQLVSTCHQWSSVVFLAVS